MEEFYIKELSLKNYRGIEESTFQLNPNFTVFIGKNAAGKTIVLEAVAVMLGAYLAAYKKYVESRYVFNISSDDPTRKQQMNMDFNLPLSAGIPQYPCEVSCNMLWSSKKFPKDKEIKYKRIIEKEGGRTKFSGRNPMQKIVMDWEEQIAKADGSDKDITFPLVLYLSSARLWNENSGSSIQGLPTRMGLILDV